MSKPNIILIYPDQQRYDCASYAGHPVIKTPNLDALAADGTAFTNAYTSFPLCCPFRASLMTGVYAHNNGMWTNHFPIRLDQPFLAELVRDAGYKTGWIGKWHLNGGNKFDYVPKEYHLGFEEFVGYSRGHKYLKSVYYKGDDPQPYTSPRYQPEYQTDQLIDFIDRSSAGGDPFMGMICYSIPHPPVKQIPDEYVIYSPEDIVLPDTVPTWERERAREFLAKYYSMIACVDREVGKLMDHLKEKGLWDNTIFIFVSDHGEMSGEHGLWHKRTFYKGSAQVPLLIHVPGHTGRVIDQLVDPSVDLTATILDYCGIEIPERMQGKSLRPLIETGKDDQRRDYVYYQAIAIEDSEWNAETPGGDAFNIRKTFPERGFRTANRVYVEKNNAPYVLFDLDLDPDETVNLVGNASRLDEVLANHARLKEIMAENGDDWSLSVDEGPEGYQPPSQIEDFFTQAYTKAIVDDPWMDKT